jgi:hypothetical protein
MTDRLGQTARNPIPKELTPAEAMSALGRKQPVVTVCDFSTMTACHADLVRYPPESYELCWLVR